MLCCAQVVLILAVTNPTKELWKPSLALKVSENQRPLRQQFPRAKCAPLLKVSSAAHLLLTQLTSRLVWLQRTRKRRISGVILNMTRGRHWDQYLAARPNCETYNFYDGVSTAQALHSGTYISSQCPS